MKTEAAPNPHETIAALEARATRISTPAGSGSIVWRSWGEGPALVLLHGGHGTWRHWIRNIPLLSETYRVLVPDLPGMGDSVALGGDRMEPIADALAAGIDLLDVGERYLLGGFSFGSMAAGYLHARQPGRVAHLLLVGSGGLGRFDPVTGQLRRWQEEKDAERRLAVHRHNLSVLMIHDPARVDDLAVAIQAHNAEHTVVNHRAAAMAANLKRCLESPPVPVTAIWGAEDVLVRNFLDERREVLAGLAAPSRVHVIPGAGHWVQYEAADIVNSLMLAALDPHRALSLHEEANHG